MVKTQPINTQSVKKHNRQQILRAIFDCDRTSQQEIANKLGISVPTVLHNVRELQQEGLVREVGEFESTGGRKAKAISLVADSRHSIGVDITEDHVEMVAVDLTGSVVRHARQAVPFACSEKYFRKVAASLAAFVKDGTDLADGILGVGFSIPGIISANQEVVEFSHILGVTDVATAQFSRDLPWPCRFINDANAAGFAELFHRADMRNAAYLSMSSSVGGAIFINGELYLGSNQRSGEFGHNTVVPGGKSCYCGKKGCLDAYCSSKILAKESQGDLEAFFALLWGGDKRCRKLWDEYLAHLAVAVNNIRMSFDCDVIVGGYVGSHMDEFIDELRARLAKLNTFGADGSYVKACTYKNEAAATGAALKHLFAFVGGTFAS